MRGLAASATVTQQYVNSSTEPVEAVYIFPLPHDSAVYDLEIRVGNRVIRSTIREREEAKRVTTSLRKSEGKRAALVGRGSAPTSPSPPLSRISCPATTLMSAFAMLNLSIGKMGRMRLVFPMVIEPALYSRRAGRLFTLAPDGLSHTGDAVADASFPSHSARPQSRQPSWP